MNEVVETIFSATETPPIDRPVSPSVPEGSHRVYCIYDNTGDPRHSQSIFLESNEYGEGSGKLSHVLGNVLHGMIFETRVDLDPTQSPSFESRVFLGSVLAADHGRLEAICRGVEVPGKQLRPNGKTTDRGRPLRKGAEWVAEVIEALYREGVVTR